MMKKIIILMFVLFMTINISYAETFEDNFIHSGGASEDYNVCYTSGASLAFYIDYIIINNVETLEDITFLQMEVPGSQLIKSYDSNYNDIILKIGANQVGTGIYGYSFNGDRSKAYIQIWFYDMDLSSYSGKQTLTMYGHEALQIKVGGYLGRCASPSSDSRYAFFSIGFDEAASGSPNSVYHVVSSYEKVFNYNYSTDTYRFIMERDVGLSSKCNITINDNLVKYETSQQTYDVDYINTSYNQWFVKNTDVYGLSITHPLIFGDIEQSSATIINNQTSYTNPKIILSDITLNIPDYNNYYYRVKVLYEKYSNFYDYAVVDYNQSQIILTDNIQYEIDINEDYYDLPTKFKVIVESYNKNTGVSVIIGESNIFMYNPTQYYDNIIDGYILDTTTNAYVSNVHIYYNNSLDSYYDLTDSNGYFKFYLPTDLYNVHIEKNNYHDTDFSQYIDYSKLTKIYITPLDEDINLYGNVLNLNTNLPLSDVKITVNNETYTQFTYSNNYGYYEFYNIQNNTNYTLIAELDNYYSFNELIVIPSDAPKYQLINLIPIIPIIDDIDTDIDQQIEDLKEEIQPIKDLIFGLSEIVIDNPDYNNDNIISENEYASFINSLVPLVIIIFIVIMYIGLKDRREKK